MPKTIGIADLTSAVEKALASVKIKPGPIILGFVAPDTLDHAAALNVAKELAKATGLPGTPTVSTVAEAAAHAHTGQKAAIPHGHIIVGLVQQES
jgi:hypothetical protein